MTNIIFTKTTAGHCEPWPISVLQTAEDALPQYILSEAERRKRRWDVYNILNSKTRTTCEIAVFEFAHVCVEYWVITNRIALSISLFTLLLLFMDLSRSQMREEISEFLLDEEEDEAILRVNGSLWQTNTQCYWTTSTCTAVTLFPWQLYSQGGLSQYKLIPIAFN